MIVQQAKEVAREWVMEEARKAAGFSGAFFHGSPNWGGFSFDTVAEFVLMGLAGGETASWPPDSRSGRVVLASQ